jgi:FdrA protein
MIPVGAAGMADEAKTMADGGADDPADGPPRLLARSPKVINVGLERFAEDLAAQGVAVQHVQWSPPAGGDARLAELLAKLGG